MAIEFLIDEKPTGEQASTGRNAAFEVPYSIEVTDLSDDATTAQAKAALEAHVADERDGLSLAGVTVEEVIPGRGWEGSAKYAPPGSNLVIFPQGEFRKSFNTQGGTQHITQAYSTVSKYPADSAPDLGNAVGVTFGADGTVEGVDVPAPVFQYEETHVLGTEIVTNSYLAKLYLLTATMNAAQFRDFAAGEALFLGASGALRNSSEWEITFAWAISPNQTNLTIGTITGIDKVGWDYLWVVYQDQEVTVGTNTYVAKKPLFAYVNRVHRAGDFSQLQLPSED